MRVIRLQRKEKTKIMETNKVLQEEYVKFLTELFKGPNDGRVNIKPKKIHRVQ